MNTPGAPDLGHLVARAQADADILAVILFGSRARGDATPVSDVDVCLVLCPTAASEPAATEKRLAYLSMADFDITVFQQLPLHLRSRVLKEGRVLFVRDEEALYALAIRTARAFEHFRHIQRRYLDEVARD